MGLLLETLQVLQRCLKERKDWVSEKILLFTSDGISRFDVGLETHLDTHLSKVACLVSASVSRDAISASSPFFETWNALSTWFSKVQSVCSYFYAWTRNNTNLAKLNGS